MYALILLCFWTRQNSALFVVVLPCLWYIMGKILLFGGWMMEQLFVVGLAGSDVGALRSVPNGNEMVDIIFMFGIYIPFFIRLLFGYLKPKALRICVWFGCFLGGIVAALCTRLPFSFHQWFLLFFDGSLFPIVCFFPKSGEFFTDRFRTKLLNFLFHRK